MKKTLLAFRWFFASLIVGLAVFGVLNLYGFYIPLDLHIPVTSEAMAHKALYTGLSIWVFLMGIPLVTLILGIREMTTSKQREKDGMHT